MPVSTLTHIPPRDRCRSETTIVFPERFERVADIVQNDTSYPWRKILREGKAPLTESHNPPVAHGAIRQLGPSVSVNMVDHMVQSIRSCKGHIGGEADRGASAPLVFAEQVNFRWCIAIQNKAIERNNVAHWRSALEYIFTGGPPGAASFFRAAS